MRFWLSFALFAPLFSEKRSFFGAVDGGIKRKKLRSRFGNAAMIVEWARLHAVADGLLSPEPLDETEEEDEEAGEGGKGVEVAETIEPGAEAIGLTGDGDAVDDGNGVDATDVTGVVQEPIAELGADPIDIKGVGASLLDELVLDVNAVVMMGGDVGGVVLDAGDDLHRGEGAAAGEEEKEEKKEENHRC